MWELKELFDPDYILNPGVILNKDPLVRRVALSWQAALSWQTASSGACMHACQGFRHGCGIGEAAAEKQQGEATVCPPLPPLPRRRCMSRT